jgi:hypothetical protein
MPRHAERAEAVFVLQASEFALDRYAATVEIAEALRVSRDARKQPPARHSNRQDNLFALHAAHRNDGIATPNFALGIDAGVVIALVHRHCLGLETTSVQRVEQRRNKQRFMVTCGARLPRERESRPGADREVDLVPVEAAALAGADCAAVSPRCVRVGELLAEFASVARPRRWSKDRDCGETSRIVAELDALE